MKRSGKSLFSLLLCLTVVFSMCFAFSSEAYAEGEGAQINPNAAEILADGSAFTPVEADNIGALKTYATPALTSGSQTFNYTVNMPEKGTLYIFYAQSSGGTGVYVDAATSTQVSGGDKGTENGVDYKMYSVTGPCSTNVRISAYGQGSFVAFTAYYVTGAKSVGTSSQFALGSCGYNTDSTFTVKVPSTGYLTVTAADGFSNYSVKLKAKGFKDYEYLSSSNGYTTNIGVKKGTYTISLRSYAPVYSVKVTFHKVKETSSKTKKATAASIKKKTANKGVVVTNKKKVHWYKVKNPKNQKMTISVNAKKMGGGGGYGSLKITAYFPNGTKSSASLSAGKSDKFYLTYGYGSTSKAMAGTYWFKVESVNGANGYYTFTWK